MRAVAVTDLVDVAEIARRLGVSAVTVRSWRRWDPQFPKPVATIGGAQVFQWSEVQRWFHAAGRHLTP